MVYYPALSFEKELLQNKYRQYTNYYYFHLNYLFDKAEVYLSRAYLVLRFDYFQGHGE